MKIWSISGDILQVEEVLLSKSLFNVVCTHWRLIAIIYSTLRAKKLHLQEMAVKTEKSDDIMTWKTTV